MISVVRYQRRTQKTGPLASFLFVAAVLLATLAGCQKWPESYTLSGATMGTTYSVKVVTDSTIDVDELGKVIDSLLVDINQSMSTYIEDSEISRLNQWPLNQPFPVSVDFMTVLQLAAKIYQQSDGAFDPSVGALVNLWGFGPQHRPDKVPEATEIQSLLASVGYDKLLLDARKLQATRTADIRIDLSAIAKGYGVDRVSDLLRSRGLDNHMVEIGGELRVAGRNASAKLWRIAVETPTPGLADIRRVLAVTDHGIATSGDYRNYFEEAGKRYSHTIDPRTGRPIVHNLASVTVLSGNAAEADGLATALMVMGPVQGLQLAERLDIPVLMLVKEPEGFVELHSDAFTAYLQEANK